MPGARLELSGLVQRFDQGKGHAPLHALGPLDLAVAAGEVFAVIGPSGCGKSSLLDIVAGLAAPAEGRIALDGQTVIGVPQGLSVVFQEDSAFPWLTVAQNVAFPLRQAGLARPEIDARVAETLALVGLSRFAEARPPTLSGGMRQRVCIARALVTRPRLLLLDEPFAALDSQTRLLMGDELLRLWRATGATILLITHALDEAAALADRIGVMSARPGRFVEVIATGWPRERDSAVAEDTHFGEITARLWHHLRRESLAAFDADQPGTRAARANLDEAAE
jgi:NitT/TauT family transport system ATP-binding protein